MNFEEIWGRVKSKTEIKTFTELANLVGTTSQYISRKKKENDFLVIWAFAVAQKYGLSTDWIMTGEGQEKRTEVSQTSKFNILVEVEEWLSEEIKKDVRREVWFEIQMKDSFAAFKAWKEDKEKDNDENISIKKAVGGVWK